MDKDFQYYETKRAAKAREQDRDDFNNESADRDVPRIKRFGFEGQREQMRAQQKQERQNLYLTIAYLTMYDNVQSRLIETTSLVYDALVEANETVASMESSASRLPDGTLVFKNEHGDIITQDGLILNAEQTATVQWQENTPAWEAYQAAIAHREKLANGYDRLGEIQNIMDDGNIEKTPEMLEGFDKEIDVIQNHVKPPNSLSKTYEADTVMPASLPDISL